MERRRLKLSVVIPALNEAGSIGRTIGGAARALDAAEIDFEVLVVDDGSTDGTGSLVERLGQDDPRIRCMRSHYPGGFGYAVRAGLERFTGDAVAIVMADGSDAPSDLVRYHGLLEEGFDCAFGTRFSRGGCVNRYPRGKLVVNRIANGVIRVLFRHGYDDTTNAFKAYRREVVESVRPLESQNFDLTVELPLKAVAHGFSFAIVPVSWTGRSAGESKLRLRANGVPYFATLLRALRERP